MSHAQITATIGEKGGGSKSTTIQNIAVELTIMNFTVVLADLDPQGTTRKWGARRRDERHKPLIDVREITARNLQKFLESNIGKYDHILLDTGGADSDGMRLALMFADTVICPCEPSQADVETLEHVDQLVGRAKVENPRLEAYILTTKAATDIFKSSNIDMKEACAGFKNMVLLDTMVGYRKVFKNALRDGLGVIEYPVNDFTTKGIAEAHDVVAEIYL